MIVIRQKIDGLYGITYAAVFAGLTLWFSAEIIWTYYELGIGIDRPFPSLADAFWLAGYGFLAYHLIKTYRFFSKIFSKYTVLVSIIGGALMLGHLIYLSAVTADVSTLNDQTAFAIALAYPILDTVLLVPAIVILSGLRGGKLTSPSWIMISLSLIIMIAGDSGFAYSSFASYEEIDWIWDVLYNTSYMTLAAALYWHNKFFIYNQGKATKLWQKENR